MPSISKPCHNCRRRRLRCDRSWPSCHKCAVAGQECLGYGKVFVWTQAIDAQGNLTPAASGRKPGPAADDSGGPGLAGTAAAVAAAAAAAARLWPGGDDGGDEGAGGGGGAETGGQEPTPPTPPPPPPLINTAVPQPSAFPSAISASASATLASLTDPLFQDLDRNSRYYLSHFADRVCKDLVARDAPGSNPFRELIPLTKKHPLLLQVLVATSAIHWSNIFRHLTPVPTGLADPGGHLALLRSRDLASRQALLDALSAKQRALGHLRHVLASLDPAGSDVALAAMHFFIKFDLIDLDKSDGRGWQAHLEAASSILSLVGPNSSNTRALDGASSRMLRDCVIADCFIYHILGSTLTSGGLAARIARYAFELLPVMKRVEVNSYLSCPPEILQIILVASQLSYEAPPPPALCADWTVPAAGDALALIDQALAFDIPAWAAHLQRFSNVADIESRVHVASAHRSAACLYILQALPLVRAAARGVDSDFLVGDILTHLAQIGERDPYFKATSWPTFIAGAETRDPARRAWSLGRLLAIWEICPWGYIFTAIEMLKATWQMQDAGGAIGVNWLQDLKGMGFDYLIV